MVMGGLKVESSLTIDASIKKLMEKNLTTVAQRTGQVFSVDKIHLLPEGMYNSEPPSRAVVTVRLLCPSLEFDYYKALHYAFYRDMKNINDPQCLCSEADRLGIDRYSFMQVYESEDAREKTREDFVRSKKAGVLGYPALILKDENGLRILNQGYKPLEPLVAAIESWLAGKSTPLIL